MRVWRRVEDVPRDIGRTAVAIGTFDGVHRGHRVTISSMVAAAAERHLMPVLVTFDPHPKSVVRPDQAPLMLSTLGHRLQLVAGLGVEATLVLPFTTELSHLTPEAFVRTVLVDAVHADLVVVGDNFRFGHRAAGDVGGLADLGVRWGFDVLPVALTNGDDTWSSTRVRAEVAAGEVEAAARVLGRPHRLEGEVVHGDHRGRELGYPTANLDLPPDAAVPADGVYAGWALRDDDVALPAAISVGTNPTFGGTVRRVEAYVLGRDDLDLYGERLAVDFVGRLRDTLRFDSVADLVEQMGRDVEDCRRALVG